MGWKRNTFRKWLCSFIVIFFNYDISSSQIDESIAKHKQNFENVALTIWDHAELGYLESKSSDLLKTTLQNNGFSVTNNVANIPTAFIAEYGKNGPVIAILGEFDALPGLAQNAVPYKDNTDLSSSNGHACGHHLFGAASAWAAVAVKEWLEESGVKGIVRFYGTPAEEGGSGKVYIAREGFFDDVDIVLHWHPSSANSANARTSNSNKSGKFTFRGISAHAAGSPEKGRSALDGVEAMNMMVNMMREHIPQESRIHYVITKGGLAPNVVPDLAQVYYYVRHPKMHMVDELFERVVKIAEGAALGTGTTMDYEVMHGNYSLLPNETLQKILHANLKKEGGIQYTDAENEFAKQIYQTLIAPSAELGSQEFVEDYQVTHSYGSTDVGDVSWLVPTGEIRVATWVPSTPSHSWQAVASGGMSIGLKGTELAAKVLAKTARDIFLDPSIIEDASKELIQRQGKDFVYYPLLGDREPPLDYRLISN